MCVEFKTTDHVWVGLIKRWKMIFHPLLNINYIFNYIYCERFCPYARIQIEISSDELIFRPCF